MESWIAIVLAVFITNSFCNSLPSGDPVEVTYAELQTLGISCYPSDSCQKNETNFGFYIQSCDCDCSCLLYDTCCVDSEYRNHKSYPKGKSDLRCLQVYNSPGFEIYMVDTCKTDGSFDNLCFSDPEDSNDPFLMVPVTSNVTGITYKNYFCAVCNEEVDSDQLLFWDLQILSNDTLLNNISEPQLNFNKTMELWTVNDGKNDETSITFPVILRVQPHVQAAVRYCSSDLIENCSSNWTDEAVALKCKDYMAKVVGFQNLTYRNPHCALCNFENISSLQCEKFDSTIFSAIPLAPAAGPVRVDTPLINLFILEGRQKRCGKNMVYDKFADKCRCNSRIYVKQNGKCVHRI